MINYLTTVDPEWDISPGTAEYKLLEAVAAQIEDLSFNNALADYHFDIDKKSGLQLDQFLSLFGFSRIKAKRATGEVTFKRGTPADRDYVIPVGTQVFAPATSTSPSIFFQTTIGTFLPTGATEVSVPIQATVAGASGNVAAGTITGLASPIAGITAVVNTQPTSGGLDAESDEVLRTRWRQTVFRNLAGTEDQFLALAFNESAFVTRAIVVGAVQRYFEQIQLQPPEDVSTSSPWFSTIPNEVSSSATTFSVATGTGTRFASTASGPFFAAIYDTAGSSVLEIVKVTSRTNDSFTVQRASSPVTIPSGAVIRQVNLSSVKDSKYTYPAGGELVGTNIGLSNQVLAVPDVDYELISSAPVPDGASLPALYVTPTGAFKFGLQAVLEMEHEYVPRASRNDPSVQRLEKIDIFMDGQDETAVVEQVPMGSKKFGTDFDPNDFLRDDGVTRPKSGNVFMRLSKAPIMAIPDTISVSASAAYPAATFVKDVDYFLVFDTTERAGSSKAVEGLEWVTPLPAPASRLTVSTVNQSGNLDGWYAYTFTFVVDGVESLPASVSTAAAANVSTSTGKNQLTIPIYTGSGTTIWRKIYRSISSSSSSTAEEGPFFHVWTIRDNTTTSWIDDKVITSLEVPPSGPPTVGRIIEIPYLYNKIAERLDAQIDLVRLVGTDTLVHQASVVPLKINLAIVLNPGASISDVSSGLITEIAAWIDRKSFRNNIQIADLVDVAMNVPGVDNVRLVRADESRDEIQAVDVIYPEVPDLDFDTFRLVVNNEGTGELPYNASAALVREALESLTSISEGAPYATTLATSVTSSDGSLTVNFNSALPNTFPYYIQIDNEIMRVTAMSGTGSTRTLTVVRGVLSSTPSAHSADTYLHILGDVAVVRTGGTSGTPFRHLITFIANAYTGINNWGNRRVDLVQAQLGNVNSRLQLEVSRVTEGVGWGIQRLALNGQTIISTFSGDIYLNTDELPDLVNVDVLVKAANTF